MDPMSAVFTCPLHTSIMARVSSVCGAMLREQRRQGDKPLVPKYVSHGCVCVCDCVCVCARACVFLFCPVAAILLTGPHRA